MTPPTTVTDLDADKFNNNMDPFLASMTFATTVTTTTTTTTTTKTMVEEEENNGEQQVIKRHININNNKHPFYARFCECCDEPSSMIPPTIRKAIQDYKRQKLNTGRIKRTQARTFICRQSQYNINNNKNDNNDNNITNPMAIWEWMLPLNAEPIVEFGNSRVNRIVWIQRLSSNSVLKSIGRGIIGSSAEEKGRIALTDWKEGDVLYLKGYDGKAIGWIHENLESSAVPVEVDDKIETKNDGNEDGNENNIKPDENEKSTTNGPAVLHIIKIPEEQSREETESNKSDEETQPYDNKQSWVQTVRQICRKIEGKQAAEVQKCEKMGLKLDAEDSDKVSKVIRGLL